METGKKQSVRDEEEEYEEEAPEDIRNQMEGTLSNKFRREIVPIV